MVLGGLKIDSINEDFIKSYNEDGDEGYFLETDVQCPEEFDKLHNDSTFLPDRIKIGKVEKLVGNFHEIKEYVIQIKSLKQVLNHGLPIKMKKNS